MRKYMKLKRKNVSKNLKPIMNRLQKYSKGSQGLAVLTGLLGQTAICSANITALDVGTLVNGATLNAAGTGSLGLSEIVDVSQSDDSNDLFIFVGNTGGGGPSVVVPPTVPFGPTMVSPARIAI